MLITYRPEGQPDEAAQRWEFDGGRVRATEAELIERRYGAKFDVWKNDVRVGSAKARRVLLWHLLRRQHPALKYEDTPDFYMDELLVEHTVAELVELRDRMAKASLDEETRVQVATALDLEITEAMAREGLVDEAAEGKATSPDVESTTG